MRWRARNERDTALGAPRCATGACGFLGGRGRSVVLTTVRLAKAAWRSFLASHRTTRSRLVNAQTSVELPHAAVTPEPTAVFRVNGAFSEKGTLFLSPAAAWLGLMTASLGLGNERGGQAVGWRGRGAASLGPATAWRGRAVARLGRGTRWRGPAAVRLGPAVRWLVLIVYDQA